MGTELRTPHTLSLCGHRNITAPLCALHSSSPNKMLLLEGRVPGGLGEIVLDEVLMPQLGFR